MMNKVLYVEAFLEGVD